MSDFDALLLAVLAVIFCLGVLAVRGNFGAYLRRRAAPAAPPARHRMRSACNCIVR